jgi:diamine N-acetyltransferase
MAFHPQALRIGRGLMPRSGTPDEVRIRYARHKDFQALSGLFEEVDELHRQHLPDLYRKARGAPREESYISGLIRDPDAAVIVAQLGAQIVGLLVAWIHRTPEMPYLVPVHYAMIDTVVVTQNTRGRGIGHALMTQAEVWARERGVNRIELNVFAFNEEALSFYRGMDYSLLSCRMVKDLNTDA